MKTKIKKSWKPGVSRPSPDLVRSADKAFLIFKKLGIKIPFQVEVSSAKQPFSADFSFLDNTLLIQIGDDHPAKTLVLIHHLLHGMEDVIQKENGARSLTKIRSGLVSDIKKKNPSIFEKPFDLDPGWSPLPDDRALNSHSEVFASALTSFIANKHKSLIREKEMYNHTIIEHFGSQIKPYIDFSYSKKKAKRSLDMLSHQTKNFVS